MNVLNIIISEKNLSVYRLSKNSNIPYATLNDICNGKTLIEKCSAETVYKLAKALDITMEELLAPVLEKEFDFELFKSNVCHHLARVGDIDFLIETMEKDEIRQHYRMKRYMESFYLLGMVDYISKENDIPLCSEYNDLRTKKLTQPVFPRSILAACNAAKSEEPKIQALASAIPEFKRHNIIENEVRNVI